MSSYIESAYSIEHRRLQQIVTKCQQELNEATSRLCKRRHEIENASDAEFLSDPKTKGFLLLTTLVFLYF